MGKKISCYTRARESCLLILNALIQQSKLRFILIIRKFWLFTVFSMSFHFVCLKLGGDTMTGKVKTDGCRDVDDFRDCIKACFSKALNFIEPYQLHLFDPEGSTEIDPQTLMGDLQEIPRKPMVVTVSELHRCSPRQQQYKPLSSAASCQKYLDALADRISYFYDFYYKHGTPTIGDVLAAKDGQVGRPKGKISKQKWWDYGVLDGTKLTYVPLPSRLTSEKWDVLRYLNRKTTGRIHDAKLPRDSDDQPYVIVSHDDFVEPQFVAAVKDIALDLGVVDAEEELIVKDELQLPVRSFSGYGSPH